MSDSIESGTAAVNALQAKRKRESDAIASMKSQLRLDEPFASAEDAEARLSPFVTLFGVDARNEETKLRKQVSAARQAADLPPLEGEAAANDISLDPAEVEKRVAQSKAKVEAKLPELQEKFVQTQFRWKFEFRQRRDLYFMETMAFESERAGLESQWYKEALDYAKS